MSTTAADSGLTRNGERCAAAATIRRAWWRAVGVVGLAIVVGIGCGVAVSPWLRIERVIVRCADPDVAREVANAVDIDPDATLVTVPLRKLKRQIRACPRVKSVSLSRRWQHTLDIAVTPRKPAVVLAAKGDCVLVDEECVCVRRVRERPPDLPVVRGPALDGIVPGDIVSRTRLDVAWQCLEWAERLPALGCLSIDVSTPQRVCVYAGDGTKGIIGRPTELGRKLACFAATLQHLRGRGWRARYVDVQDARVGAIWYPAPGSPVPPASAGA